MKKLVVVTGAIMITSLTFAQKLKEKEVPSQVKNAFQKEYPSVKNVKWGKEGENYEAGYEVNKVDNSVLFDSSGNLVQKEIEIETKQLPRGVLDYVQANYKGQKVKETAKIIDASGIITYEVEIKDMDLLFDSNGKFIKSMKG